LIEIPESFTYAKQLNETVKGKRIAEVEAGHTPHGFAWYEGDPKEYGPKLEGKVAGESRGLGSLVEIEAEDYCFVSGDGTNIRYYEKRSQIPERYQTRITFEDDSSLICTVQMYGAMFLIKPAEYDNFYYQITKQKPFPFTEEFDYEYFKTLREDVTGKLSIKAFLATQQRIPGLGNGVLQDILLEAGLHPKKKIGSLRENDWKKVYEAVVTILKKMLQGGGRDTEKDLFGNPGGYVTKLSKKTFGKPCPYCGNTIQKAAYLGGTVYFCTGCQSL